MYDNPFVLPTDSYKRDLNVLKHYIDDQALHLHVATGDPLAECEAFVRKAIGPGGVHELKDPTVYYLERNEHGDRQKKQTTMLGYLGESVRAAELIAPTFTTYLNPQKKKALLVEFIDTNVAARSAAKKAMFAAENVDQYTYNFKKGEQTNRKLSNNSISGAHVSASTPLYNKTAHSTLTSNCRATAGYGNANNEKFLSGNRHYWSPAIVRNNIISIVNHTDYAQLQACIEKWGIVYPSAGQMMECIAFSTQLYWRSDLEMQRLEELAHSLTPIQRAAFVYTGDLYQLARFNDTLVRTFLCKLTERVVGPHPDPASVWKSAPEDHIHFAAMLWPTEMKGLNLKQVKGTPFEGTYAATTVHVAEVLAEYYDLIRALWVTVNVPASMAWMPDSVRRAAITGDTDSTIFTVQDWVIWYRGKIKFDDEAKGLANAMIFLAAQAITHVLARMSANFGIEQKRLYQIAMKNEYYFPIFTPTQVAKHYYAVRGAQEGAWKKGMEMEIKGVHLKSSNAPPSVMKDAERMMEFICTEVMEERLIDAAYIMKWVADIERSVYASITKGSHEYFRISQLKSAESYTKSAEASPYQHYTLWQEVFAPKYGDSQPPPYMAVKISADLDTPTKTREWIASMEDRELAARLEAYMERTGKKHMGTSMQLPEQCVNSKGIPTEILDVIGVRKIVLETTKVFYIIMETLGLSMLNDKTTRLISDTH
ncbi:hypothetical protein D3C71_78940 [compost metagenome]